MLYQNRSMLVRGALVAVLATVCAAAPAAAAASEPVRTSVESAGEVRNPPRQCGVGDLEVALGDSEGAAGTVYHALVFTNTGRRTCTIQGFPTVSFVAGEDAHQVGAPATRSGTTGAVVTLAPGGTATSPLGVVNVDNFDPAACRVVPVRGLRVYPPNQRQSELVSWSTRACSGPIPESQLKVATVHPGSGLS
jgi:hypothetical protein